MNIFEFLETPLFILELYRNSTSNPLLNKNITLLSHVSLENCEAYVKSLLLSYLIGLEIENMNLILVISIEALSEKLKNCR